jgi:mannose/fructose/N-acetylgalactosamine-specific phosphotransferase system component IID
MKSNKKGIAQLQDLIIGLVIIGIVLVVSFLILAQVAANSTVAADANATAAVQTTQSAMDDIPGWLPIIVVTVIGAFILGLITLFRRRA